jgi:hypothetical protein
MGCTSPLGYETAKAIFKSDGQKVRGGALPVSFEMFTLDSEELLTNLVSTQLDVDHFAALVNSFQVGNLDSLMMIYRELKRLCSFQRWTSP